MVTAEAGSQEEGRNCGETDIILASMMLGVVSESRNRIEMVGSWKRAGRRLSMKVDWHWAVSGVRALLNSVAAKFEDVDIVGIFLRI
jgi:hypothetical protein